MLLIVEKFWHKKQTLACFDDDKTTATENTETCTLYRPEQYTSLLIVCRALCVYYDRKCPKLFHTHSTSWLNQENSKTYYRVFLKHHHYQRRQQQQPISLRFQRTFLPQLYTWWPPTTSGPPASSNLPNTPSIHPPTFRSPHWPSFQS